MSQSKVCAKNIFKAYMYSYVLSVIIVLSYYYFRTIYYDILINQDSSMNEFFGIITHTTITIILAPLISWLIPFFAWLKKPINIFLPISFLTILFSYNKYKTRKNELFFLTILFTIWQVIGIFLFISYTMY